MHTPIVNDEYIGLTFFKLGCKFIFVNRMFAYKICFIFVRFLNDICIFRMLCLVIVKDCAESCEVIVFVKGIIFADSIRIFNTVQTVFFTGFGDLIKITIHHTS